MQPRIRHHIRLSNITPCKNLSKVLDTYHLMWAVLYVFYCGDLCRFISYLWQGADAYGLNLARIVSV